MNNLTPKFKYSLLIFPIILGITFLAAYLILENFNNENEILLKQADETYIPNLENSIIIKHKLFELQQTFQNAVSANDEELFENADSLKNQIIYLLEKIKYHNNNDFKKQLIKDFEDYYYKANIISHKLIEENITANLEQEINLLIDKYNIVLDELTNLGEQSKIDSKNQIMLIEENNNRAAYINLYVILGGFLISIIITFLVSKNVVKPFKILNNELARINSLLSDKNSELEIISQELKESVQTKDKFFSIIAHDLRSPLGGLMKLTEFVVEDFDSLEKEELREMLLAIEGSSEKVFDLLENLLEWSRLQRGVIPFEPINLNLKHSVDDIIKLLKDSITHKNIKIKCEFDDVEVFADSKMLKGILRNLLSNAIKFTPSNGEVIIDIEKQDKFIKVNIIDTGIGMSQNIIDNLFKIEVNTSREGTNGESSSGLGLIICKEFVEKMGGFLSVESEENKGSKFSFTIPQKIDVLN